jgi:hypothetical protein
MDRKVVATISDAVQVGEDAWKQVYTSRVFATSRPIDDILSWAKAQGFKSPTISDIQFSEYTGESI